MIVTTTPRDVSWDIVATALQRGGWACFAPAPEHDAVAAKARKVARRSGIRIEILAEDGRVFALARIQGRCGVHRGSREGTPEGVERRDLEAVADLQRTIRVLMAEMEAAS